MCYTTYMINKVASQWGTREEILANAMRTLETEVEWPLTEILPLAEVNALLAPIRARINAELGENNSLTR